MQSNKSDREWEAIEELAAQSERPTGDPSEEWRESISETLGREVVDGMLSRDDENDATIFIAKPLPLDWETAAARGEVARLSRQKLLAASNKHPDRLCTLLFKSEYAIDGLETKITRHLSPDWEVVVNAPISTPLQSVTCSGTHWSLDSDLNIASSKIPDDKRDMASLRELSSMEMLLKLRTGDAIKTDETPH